MLAVKVAELVSDVPQKWADLTARMPQLGYLIPNDLHALLDNLRDRHLLVAEVSASGVPLELARREGDGANV